MKQCSFCKIEKPENDFYMYSITKMTRGREQRGYVCKVCSDRTYGDIWFPIKGYDQMCEISNHGHVREIKENRYFDITHVQNSSTKYVYLTKGGENLEINIQSLMKRFVHTN